MTMEIGLGSLQGPRDELLHDLVGAAIDGLDAGVNEGAGDRVLHHVAPAAEELQA